jgi:hypothetical protein
MCRRSRINMTVWLLQMGAAPRRPKGRQSLLIRRPVDQRGGAIHADEGWRLRWHRARWHGSNPLFCRQRRHAHWTVDDSCTRSATVQVQRLVVVDSMLEGTSGASISVLIVLVVASDVKGTLGGEGGGGGLRIEIRAEKGAR